MAEMTDEERERRYQRLWGEEEVSPMRAILDSPWGDKLWGARFKPHGPTMLQQAREDRLRKEKEEASRRKDKDPPEPKRQKIHGNEQQGNPPPPETIHGEEGKGNPPPPEPERETIQVDEEQGNSQPPSERNTPSGSLLPPYYQDPDPEAPQYFDDMAKFYLEAARRLPLAQMPKLAGFLSLGGVLLGLNDPVTNIIVNAIYLMGNFRHSDVLPHGADPVRHAEDKASYVHVARRSRAALVVFMVSYFRHLTEAQAKRYLHAAGQDLALAVGLVEFHRKGKGGFCGIPPELFDELSPDCSRTKTALRYAARAAMLPQDPNDLVRLLTSRFPRHLFDLVLDDLRRGEKLSVGRVKDILNLLRHSWSPSPLLPAPTPGQSRDDEGNLATGEKLSVKDMLNLLRHPWSPSPLLPAPTPGHSRDDKGNLTIITNMGQGLFSTTTITAATYNSNKNGGKDVASTTNFLEHPSGHDDHDGDNLVGTAYLSTDLDRKGRFHSFMCTTAAQQLEPDMNSLRMCLLDTIHGFYIEALAMLPSDHHPRLLHAVLAAGHCYGIMDKPVHNIIINSIWYGLCYPPPNDETVQIDPLSLTRIASSSLNGLMVLRHNDQGAILTEEHMMSNLLGRMDCLAHPESGNADYLFLVAAAEAAKHPQPLRLVEFIKGLLPYKNRLHEVMNLKPALSDSDLYMIRDIIAAGVTKILPRNPDPGQPTLMDPGRRVQAHVRTKLEKLLLNYCCKYRWGPQYKLSIILGVASTVCSSYIKGTTCYHANFLASTGDVPASGCILFFAEFWNQEDDDFEESKMPPACWPVPHEDIRYHRRCFICEGAAIRVVHPFDVNYFMGQRCCTDSLCAVAEHEAALGGTEVKISNRL